MPELYTAATRDEIDRLLLARVALFVDTLGYDPENVTVLAPTRGDVARIGQLLARAGRTVANIHDEAFAFSQAGAVRLSTLHSSKGLDFPVVLLYLPGLPTQGDYDEAAGDTLARNLIYVAMTRAMDNLSVFTMAAPAEKPLADLVAVFADRPSRRERSPLEPLARRPVRPVPARLPVPVPRRRSRRLHHDRAAPRPGGARRARAGVRRALPRRAGRRALDDRRVRAAVALCRPRRRTGWSSAG